RGVDLAGVSAAAREEDQDWTLAAVCASRVREGGGVSGGAGESGGCGMRTVRVLRARYHGGDRFSGCRESGIDAAALPPSVATECGTACVAGSAGWGRGGGTERWVRECAG